MTTSKLEAVPAIVRQYLNSRSTQIALIVGVTMYVAYAATHRQWLNPALIGVCAFVSLLLPWYSKLSNKVEEKTNLRFAIVTLGRLSRFALQLVFNAVIFLAFEFGGVLEPGSFEGVGGILGITVLTTIASQGAQYIAVTLFNRGVGDLNRNVMCALAANVLVTAAATTGLHMIKVVFVASSLILGALIFSISLFSDLRSWLYPRKGIGIFFGTFNPFHVTHVAIVKRALEKRQLSKIIIHSTVVPRLHALALQRGEIYVARIENGQHVLERTKKADLNVNYFPTGNRFYPPETRKLMIDLSLEEAGLKDSVDLLWLPEVYEQRGFHGVIEEIKRMYPGTPLHGLHGSDLGGMWVRGIYDESGWIYPFPVRRRDGFSATAIGGGQRA
jgi:hypothetical protein